MDCEAVQFAGRGTGAVAQNAVSCHVYHTRDLLADPAVAAHSPPQPVLNASRRVSRGRTFSCRLCCGPRGGRPGPASGQRWPARRAASVGGTWHLLAAPPGSDASSRRSNARLLVPRRSARRRSGSPRRRTGSYGGPTAPPAPSPPTRPHLVLLSSPSLPPPPSPPPPCAWTRRSGNGWRRWRGTGDRNGSAFSGSRQGSEDGKGARLAPSGSCLPPRPALAPPHDPDPYPAFPPPWAQLRRLGKI